MFRKKFGLTTMALATVLALFTPVIASAHDRDDYYRHEYRHNRDRDRHERARGYWGRDGCWHRW